MQLLPRYLHLHCPPSLVVCVGEGRREVEGKVGDVERRRPSGRHWSPALTREGGKKRKKGEKTGERKKGRTERARREGGN